MGRNMLMVLSFLGVFSLATGLKCYSCITINNPSDPCHNPGENVTSSECSAPFSKYFKKMCLSVYREGFIWPGVFDRSIYRGCHTVRTYAYDHCETHTYAARNATAKMCYCSTDNCIGDGNR